VLRQRLDQVLLVSDGASWVILDGRPVR